ncbi:9, 12-octadecadienoate 8-hydroperoxide 8R-isomerase [Aspergillus niger]|uniref:9, 12-octadecadienoate 8-hydroperoxide 8R-isomerase n=1 Tax=Aspergillus niger TaxID=5061 RepID=A0A505HVX3_ASPNG|nr:9, 12-octadecadienoate 8-hydroperoxide 8R-isomerase [Aspergillus niger]
MPPPPERQKTTIVAISGPSSSGKTTLARLLQRIFSKLTPQATNTTTNTNLRTFIVHEDDFYHPDDKIPLIPHPRDPTTQIQNWDTLSALDIPFLSASLSYIHAHGHLPPRLRSKEDLNDVAESGVSEEVVSRMREVVRGRVPSYFLEDNTNSVSGDGVRTIVFLEGFLLFAPPKEEDPRHGLRDVQEKMDDHAWLLLPEGEEGSAQTAWKDADTQELVRLVGQGVNLRLDTGVTVAPGQGKASMTDILEWAVEEVLKHIAETEGQ